MRRLRVRCADCGDFTLPADEITVTGTTDFDHVSCSFRCPACGTRGEQKESLAAGRMLLLAGARSKPPVVGEPPPLTAADLDALRALLERPDFVALMGRAA